MTTSRAGRGTWMRSGSRNGVTAKSTARVRAGRYQTGKHHHQPTNVVRRTEAAAQVRPRRCAIQTKRQAQAIRARPIAIAIASPTSSPVLPSPTSFTKTPAAGAAIRLRDARAASAPDERAPWPLRRRSGLPPPQERPPGPHPPQVPLPPPPPVRWCLTVPQPNRYGGKT